MTTTATTSDRHPDHRRPLYVYEAPVRVWHWIHATCIFCLIVTGYLIANPLPDECWPSYPREAMRNSSPIMRDV